MATIMLDDALRNLAGPLGDFAKKLSGQEGSTKWLPAFKRFLRQENPWDGKPLFETWKTVRIGEFRSADEIVNTLDKEGFGITNCVRSFLEKHDFTFCQAADVDLVRVTPEQLGLTRRDTYPYSAIFRRIQLLGLQPCPLEAVFQARRQFLDQRRGDDPRRYLKVVMKTFHRDDLTEWALELVHGEVDLDCSGLLVAEFEVGTCLLEKSWPFLCVKPR